MCGNNWMYDAEEGLTEDLMSLFSSWRQYGEDLSGEKSELNEQEINSFIDNIKDVLIEECLT